MPQMEALLSAFQYERVIRVMCSLPSYFFQVRYETPPRFHRKEGEAETMPLPEGSVNFHFKRSLASGEDAIPVAFPRNISLREASFKLRSVYNVGSDKCTGLVLGEETFTEARAVRQCPKFTFLSMTFIKFRDNNFIYQPVHLSGHVTTISSGRTRKRLSNRLEDHFRQRFLARLHER